MLEREHGLLLEALRDVGGSASLVPDCALALRVRAGVRRLGRRAVRGLRVVRLVLVDGVREATRHELAAAERANLEKEI